MLRLTVRSCFLACLMLVAILALPSCSDSPSEPGPNPTITVSIDPVAATVEQGGSTDVAVTVTGQEGFSGTATISVEGVPAGVTGTVGNVQTAGGTTTGTVTILVGAAVAPGNYDITVQATGNGVAGVTVTFALTVTAAPAYELSANPEELVVDRGAQATTDITIARTNFTEDVTLAVEGAPAGMTTSFDVNPVAGDAVVLTIEPDATVGVDLYTLTIRSTSASLPDRILTISVSVVEAPAYELSADPDQLIIEQDAQATTDIAIARTNFTGEVTLSVEGGPAGMTTSFNVNPVAGNAAVLTIAPDATVAIDTYTLTVRGTSATLADQTLAISVSVTESTAPDFMLDVTPSELTIQQGLSDQALVTITRSNFAGPVTLTTEDVPAEVTVTFAENPVDDDDTQMTVEVGAAVPPGNYAFSVTAAATGVSDRTVTVTLAVVAPPAYTLSLNPTSISIDQATSGTVDVAIDRTNFTGAVTLSLEDTPAGVTGQFSASPTTGSASVLTLEVGPAVADGSYTLTVRGTTASLADRTATLTLAVVEPPAYALSLDPTSISIDGGDSGTVNIAIARTNFTDDVSLSLEGAPAGVTGQFSVNPVPGTASVLTLDVGLAVTPGPYTLTVRGTTASLSDRTATLALTVVEPAGFSIDPIAPLSIQQGGSDTRSVTLTRTGGFTGDVTMTVTGLPVGITETVDPVTTGGASVDITLDVAATVPVGSYTATVRGDAPALPEATQTLDISITSSGGQSISLDFSTCTASDAPTWFAYQDGADPWTPIDDVAGVYTFNLSANEASIAFATVPGAGESNVVVFRASTAEFASVEVGELCDVPPSGKTVFATLDGVTFVDRAFASLGGSTVQGSGPVTFENVPDGPVDLVAYRTSLSVPDRMYILRGQNPTDGQNIGTIDFNAFGSFAASSATITVQGGTGDPVAWGIDYATSPASGTCYRAPLQTNTVMFGTQFTAGGVAEGRQSAGEYHVVTLNEGLRTVSETFRILEDRTVAFGQSLPMGTVTDISGGAAYRRVRYETTLPAEYNGIATLGLSDNAGDRSLVVLASAGWLGGTNVSLEVPDFTALTGWDNGWAPGNAGTTTWIFSATGATGGNCTEGARTVSDVDSGTIN